jgi:hypothetical protein
VTAFDAFWHRRAGVPLAAVYADFSEAAETALEEERYVPKPQIVPGTKFHTTAEAVEAEENAELDRLAELIESGLSPLEACRALSVPISERSHDAVA